MKIELDLNRNMYDYFEESIRYYEIADENGTHEEAFSNYDKKIKWKMAYITLIQSFELLIKARLKKILDILIYENIDMTITNKSKTISSTKGIERLYNCNPELVSIEEKGFIKECIEIRNSFIHYDVDLDTAEIKPKYCKMYSLFVKLHNELDETSNEVYQKIVIVHRKTHENIMEFSKGYVVFRNEEMPEEFKNYFLKEIANNKKMGILIDKAGVKYNRYPYGNTEWNAISPLHEFCPDCAAALGEFHYEGCDIEICPKCHRQLLSCECELKIYEE